MKKFIGLLLFVFMITACGATLLKSRTADVAINNQEYSIYVQAMDSPSTCDITLFVNNTEVAKGRISQITPQTVISGKYKGVKFDAECGAAATGGLNAAMRCIVYAKSKKVAELSF